MFAPRRLAAALALCALALGCRGDSLGVGGPAPTIDAVSVAANPHNVLSAVLAVRVRGADSVAAHVRAADSPTAVDATTPAVPVAGDSASILVLGLLADRRYTLRVVAYGAGKTIAGGPLEFTTGELPPDLPRYVASGPDPTPGYVVFAAGRYGLAIDNTGRVVWYRAFTNGPGLAFMAQPTGRYFARLPPALPTDPTPWVELDPSGNVTRTIGCARGLSPRVHDIIAQTDRTYWLMCDETRAVDLSGVGGVPHARVTGTVVQRVSADGALLFDWSPFDHFDIADSPLRDRAGANVNWTHGNALDLAPDGNLIVSFRNLGEVTKIDAVTGAVIWRLGGPRNDFTFVGDAGVPFVAQHGARMAAPGTVLLLDNLGTHGESRAERYALDERAMTARLVRSYSAAPTVVTEIGGSVQDLPGGHTLVSFGTAGRVEEYDAAGRVVWRIEPNAGYVFRAQRIRSLYAPGSGAHFSR
jgi:hypothetical protein